MELLARADNMAALHRHHQVKIGEKKIARLKSVFLNGYAKFWVEDRLLADYAEKNGVQVSEKTLRKFQESAFRNFKAASDGSYDEMVKAAKLDLRLWNDQVRSEAVRHEVGKYWTSRWPTNLPPTYADEEIGRMMAWNARMALTNALVHARATNVWEQLKAGADFVKTARVNTDLTDEIVDDCEWGAIDAKFLSDEPSLRRVLKTMRPGEFSPPVAADGGLLIVRLERFEPEDEVYTLSRIFFRLPRFLTPAPKEEIVKAAYDRHAKRLFRRKLDELVRGAKVFFRSESKLTKPKENKNK